MARASLKNVCRLIEAAKTTLPVEQEFLADLKRSIELTDTKNSRLPSKTYKPSSLQCIRQMYYQVVGKEYTPESNYCLVGICESGTDRHERIQNAVVGMKNNGIDCEYIDVADFVKSRELKSLEIVAKQGNETKLFHKDLNMSFLCDGIIRYHNHYYIIEFKTESIYKWQSRTGVNPDHYDQATAYSVALGLDEVVFVYINRDNTDMKCYKFDVTSEMKSNLVGKIDLCDQFVKAGKLPPKPDPINKHACQYCSYVKYCKGDEA